jgi:hypothetical protein
MVSVSAIELITGKAGTIAQILAPGLAVAALAAGPSKPGHANAFARRKTLDTRADLEHGPDDFMARHDRMAGPGQFTVNDMQIGPTHPAGPDADQNLTGLWHTAGPGDKLQRLSRPVEGQGPRHRLLWHGRLHL